MKKLLIFSFIFVSLFSFSACGKKKQEFNLSTYMIEQREHLFVASDEDFNITLTSGVREQNYAFDGSIGEMVPFAILTLSRNDNQPLNTGNYNYIVTINDVEYTGELTANAIDNRYSADLEIALNPTDVINTKINFDNYNFAQDMENVSTSFNVDKNSAINLASNELKTAVDDLTSDGRTKVEGVVKILKDYSTTTKTYFWYVGVVSTNGETLGILIDANSGEVVAKKI